MHQWRGAAQSSHVGQQRWAAVASKQRAAISSSAAHGMLHGANQHRSAIMILSLMLPNETAIIKSD
jgi:hypothetical protein